MNSLFLLNARFASIVQQRLLFTTQTHPASAVSHYVECMWQQYVFRLWRRKSRFFRLLHLRLAGCETMHFHCQQHAVFSAMPFMSHSFCLRRWQFLMRQQMPRKTNTHRTTASISLSSSIVPQKIYKYVPWLNEFEHDIGKNEHRRRRIITIITIINRK